MPQQHYYLPSGWCVCGHHRDTDLDPIPPRAEIRRILGPTYTPRDPR